MRAGVDVDDSRQTVSLLRTPISETIFDRPRRDATGRKWWAIVRSHSRMVQSVVPAEPRAVDDEGPREALDRLTREVYDDLRVVARRQLALRAGGGTLSTTGLVHEAWLKLQGQARVTWKDESHFMALACLAMRHVLVDRAKARFTRKRGGFQSQHSLDDAIIPAHAQPELLLQLNDAIDRLAAVDLRLAQVVDCRFFGGLSDQEIATAMGVTPRTVQRDWLKARMLLRRAMAP